MAHPPADVLSRFVAGALDDAMRAEVERELARCAECRAAIGALARSSPRTRSVEDTLPAPLRLVPGARIGGRYRVIGPIGEGGMGAVHEVEHELLGRRFAMKTLHPALALHPEAVRRFTAEARAAAAIEHPAIVDVVDLGRTDDGAPFLVMELLEGMTLDAWLGARERASVDDALAIAGALVSALAAAHARGIVHRDVKPANVFLEGGDPERLKLLDFGVAKLADAEGRTRSGMLLGTPRYMAPEQWLAAPDVDARADVFAVGVLLFRMLSGELPYGWSSLTLESAAPSLRDRVEGMPPALVQLVDRCIARDRAERPDGANVLVEEIDAIRATRARIRAGSVSEAPPLAPSLAPSIAPPPGPSCALVGRERELEALERTVIPGHVIALVGPPGIGKSALLRAWAARHDVVDVHIAPDDVAHPMRALARALEGGSVTDASRDRLAWTVARGLDRLASRPSAMLVIDGAMLDAPSARAIRERIGATSGLAVLIASRDEPAAAAILELLGAELLPLRGLEVEAVAELARAAGVRAEPARLHARTGGNPLFVEQLLALEASTGTRETGWPADVHAAVRARIAALPAPEARAWRLAAVIGGPFAVDDLAALGVEDASAAIAALVRREVLVVQGGRAVFAAEVLSEVARELVPDDARAALHGEIALLRARDATPDWAEVARHHEEARDLERARDAYARAAIDASPSLAAERRAELAARAIALGARSLEVELVRADALEMSGAFDAALVALDAASPVDARGRAEVLLRRGVLLQRTGRGAAGTAALAEAVAQARDGAPAATLARALGKHAVAMAYAQELESARDALAEAERLVVVKAPTLRAEAAVWRAQIAGVSGDLGDRRSAYWAAVELYREAGDLRLAAGAAMNLADTYNQLGAFDEAERALVSARADCLALGVRVMAGYAALNLGYARVELGELEGAERALGEARAIADETGEGRLGRFVELYRARLDRRAGRLADAALSLALLSARASADGEESMHALAESALARVRLETGDVALALVCSQRALAVLASLGGLEEGEAELHWTHARCLAREGRNAESDAARATGAAFVRELARRIGDREWRSRLLEDVEAHRALLSDLPL